MFVTGLINDWKRKIEGAGRSSHTAAAATAADGYETTFLSQQRNVWTPPEVYEKCCPRWLAGSGVASGTDTTSSFIRQKNGNWTCHGGCNKIHPTITLYFEYGGRVVDVDIGDDADEVDDDGHPHKGVNRIERNHCTTIAILSCRLDPFTMYFDSRVKDGSAVYKTPLYYELDGFLRENLFLLRHQQQYFGSHLVEVAMGAMQQSDTVQQQVLEEEYCSTSTVHRTNHTFDRLQEVLEICTQHRLAEDLDVMSIYCMQRTSQIFQRIATPIAQKRMKQCQLVVSSFLDGYYVDGYSVFRRSDQNRASIQYSGRRPIQYAIGPQFVLTQPNDGTELMKFVPQKSTRKKNGSSSTSHCSSASTVPIHVGESSSSSSKDDDGCATTDTFAWACEELSVANLEREWGDIGCHEYVGQRFLIQWRRTDADIVGGTTTTTSDLTTYDLVQTSRQHGSFPISHTTSLFSFDLLVHSMEAARIDDVTICFRGSATILSCEVDFRYLVAVYARTLVPYLKVQYQQIQQKRPLLRREVTFMTELHTVMSLLGSSSSSS